MIHDAHGLPDPIAVAQREHCDHKPTRKLDLVIECPDEWALLLGDTQTDALMDLAEVLRVAGRGAEASPIVADALRRYERKEVLPAAARARALLEELAPSGDAQAPA